MTTEASSTLLDIKHVAIEPAPPALSRRFARRVSVITRGVVHGATPLVARLGRQRVELLVLKAGGVGFHGFLAHAPQPGDRLFVGYGSASSATSFVVGPEGRAALG